MLICWLLITLYGYRQAVVSSMHSIVLTSDFAKKRNVLEVGNVLQNQCNEYYDNKIKHIEQDLIDLEKGIVHLYDKKSTLINQWGHCLECKGIRPDLICEIIVNRLIELDLKKGINYVYKLLPSRYKDPTRVDNGALSHDDDWAPEYSGHIKLPHNLQNLARAPKEQLQDNERFIRDHIREWRRRHNEYTTMMHQRGIAMVDDDDHDVISTPQPYNPKQGYLYQEARKCAEILYKFGDTYKQITENIYNYPPQSTTHEVRQPECSCQACEAEDQALAKGLSYWVMYYSALFEYHRPFADKKFSQPYTGWFKTEILNKHHGKHAAAVMSKVVSYLGEERSLTREAVGDSLVTLYKKLIQFAGAFEMTMAIIDGLPKEWHERLMVPVIAHRKIKLSPILSDSAFGSEAK